MLTAQRGLATGFDYATLALPLGLLAGIAALRRSRSTAPSRPPLSSTRVRLMVAAGASSARGTHDYGEMVMGGAVSAFRFG